MGIRQYNFPGDNANNMMACDIFIFFFTRAVLDTRGGEKVALRLLRFWKASNGGTHTITPIEDRFFNRGL